MKKTLAGVLAALMVFTMGTTVFAAPSSTKDSDLKKEAQELVTTVESGNSSVTLNSAVVATEDLTAVYEEVSKKIGSDTGFKVLAAVEITTSVTTLPSGGVSIKFPVSDLTSGTKNVRIYHWKESSEWEIKTPYVGNGYVTATFDSLSPFFVVKYDSTPSTSDGSEDQSSVVNNYYNTYNTYNNTNSNNTTTVNNTNSNNTTTTNNTNSNNTTTTTNTDSYNTTTTTNGKQASSKKPDSAATDTTTKKDTDQKDTSKKDTTNKDTSSGQSASANSTNDNSSKNDNSSNNTQTVTVNVGGSGSGSAKAGASTSTTSPKTGSSLPALPMIAVFLVMGIAVCGKKARNL
jgi:hypothetical protein